MLIHLTMYVKLRSRPLKKHEGFELFKRHVGHVFLFGVRFRQNVFLKGIVHTEALHWLPSTHLKRKVGKHFEVKLTNGEIQRNRIMWW